MNLRYSLDLDSKEPRRCSEGAAGIDVYLPTFTKLFIERFNSLQEGIKIVDNEMIIPAFRRVLIPTGLHFNIPEGTYLDVGTKSGRFRDTGLKVGSHVIDHDYQGEIMISLFNTAAQDAVLVSGQSIAQLIHKNYVHSTLSKTSPGDLYSSVTTRGSNGFGSTDGYDHGGN